MEKNFVTQQINYIESEVYRIVKPLGFTKHGRTLHRFVSEDISQVINFQCGQAYLNTTHLLSVNIGIRIPECFERQFHIANDKTYYHEYECNMRTRLGIVKTKRIKGEKVYDLDKDVRKICRDIIYEIEADVLPVFDVFSINTSFISLSIICSIKCLLSKLISISLICKLFSFYKYFLLKSSSR